MKIQSEINKSFVDIYSNKWQRKKCQKNKNDGLN